jgi:serine/threonine protein kinase
MVVASFTMAVDVGTLVTQSVRLVRPLGAGGMGSVWIADHLTLRTQVVVKFMTTELATDPASVARFSREAAAASQVKSPHVVQMFDHGVTTDGVPFIVMELLEGCDLAHRFADATQPRLALGELGTILAQTCKALGRAHERGIVHRDIKPDNIFLCNNVGEDVFVKLLDFGIAKASDGQGPAMAQTKTGAFMGTPYYMSPEQAIGLKTIDHRTDLWSLGVVMFEGLTGRRPFEADNIGGLVVAIHSGPIPSPSTFNPALPPSVDAWFLRACARDVGQRFSSAKEMSDAFAAAVRAPTSSGAIVSGVPASPYASTLAPSIQSAPPYLAQGMSTTGAGVSTRDWQPPPSTPVASKSKGWLVGVIATLVLGGGTAVAVVATRSVSPTAAARAPKQTEAPITSITASLNTASEYEAPIQIPQTATTEAPSQGSHKPEAVTGTTTGRHRVQPTATTTTTSTVATVVDTSPPPPATTVPPRVVQPPPQVTAPTATATTPRKRVVIYNTN